MNVKKGDLAYTVGMFFPENNGRLVLVVRPYVDGERLPGHRVDYELGGDSSWVCDSLGAPLLTNADGLQMRRAIADACLRPIRDPGEDATDETLEWLPVPTKQGEPA